MRKFLIILGLICLLFDLAGDDFIGMIKHVAPQKGYSSITAQHSDDDRGNKVVTGKGTMVATLPANLSGNFHYQYQSVVVKVPHPCKLVSPCHFCSSGGIPL